ncbi:MAG: radical SAM family heme chaperone HemW [Flavobacteriales bacterium]|jgi:oxygen-independent coproporphyrinogen-3 oxidase
MAGIYFHIPFCKQACHYCDFHFSTSLNQKEDMVKAILMEMKTRQTYLAGQKIDTIYFGGGTPSLLKADEINRLIDAVYDLFEVNDGVEITLEANPDDLLKDGLQNIRATPVNRLSIGIQSFRDEDLKWMNRAHRSVDADYAVKGAQDMGIENITVDLIYAIPGLSMLDWQRNVQRVIDMNVPHVSAYCLTIEDRTAFGNWYKKGQLVPAPDEMAGEHFLFLVERLKEAEIFLYEVSNFSKKGFESKHNSAYWEGAHYLGLGPSAHSYNGDSRSWNVANNSRYMKGIFTHEEVSETEQLDLRTRYNEWIMTGLRRAKGISIEMAHSTFGVDLLTQFEQDLQAYLEQGDAVVENGFLKLSTRGFLIADRIASDLFILES